MLPRVLRRVFDHVSAPCPRANTSYKVSSRVRQCPEEFRACPILAAHSAFPLVYRNHQVLARWHPRLLNPMMRGLSKHTEGFYQDIVI